VHFRPILTGPAPRLFAFWHSGTAPVIRESGSGSMNPTHSQPLQFAVTSVPGVRKRWEWAKPRRDGLLAGPHNGRSAPESCKHGDVVELTPLSPVVCYPYYHSRRLTRARQSHAHNDTNRTLNGNDHAVMSWLLVPSMCHGPQVLLRP
jgi:hypothetical protein